jgi:hypothetical protein
MSLVMLATGMAYMFFWNPVIHHVQAWDTGGDLWGIFRAAHYVGWGDLGGVYTSSNSFLSFPGISILLAPVAMLSSVLHLTESDPMATIAHPTAALVLQPVEILLSSTVIFAVDALAERLTVAPRRRIALCATVAVIAWATAVIWGHAEDSLATAFAIYAMIALIDRKWARCGWLFGLAIVTQPLVGLLLPMFVAATPRGQRVLLAVRATVLSLFLIGVAFAGHPGDTYRALVKQPTPPSINHATPWISLAPVVSNGGIETVHHASFSNHLGRPVIGSATSTVHSVVFVAGGLGRSIDLVLALLFGLYVWRRPQDPFRFLWLAAVVLASRSFFEAVMTPYYIAPPLFLALVLAARQGGKRFWAAVVLALEITVFAYHHLNPWVWWVPIVAGLAAIVALGFPGDGPGITGPTEVVECDNSQRGTPTGAPAVLPPKQLALH